MKPAITAVLVVLALQALSIGASQSQSESAHINEVDFSDAAVFDVVSAVDLGTQKIDLSRQFIDISGVLRALQNVLNAINQQIQNSTNALANAISNALRQAETVIANVINDWNSRLQGVIDEAARLNATVAQCQAQQQPNLQAVKDALNADVQQCVSTSTTAAQAALAELSTLGPQAQALLDQASQDIADCASAGLLQALCVAGRLRPLALQGVGLAASATQLGAKVTVELVVQVPMQSTLCVGSAVQNRTAQAAAVIEAIRQCVRNGLATATTTAATP